VASAGINAKGCWVVITAIVAPPPPTGNPSGIISQTWWEDRPDTPQTGSSQPQRSTVNKPPCQESWGWGFVVESADGVGGVRAGLILVVGAVSVSRN
jgi:hypothetical protein